MSQELIKQIAELFADDFKNLWTVRDIAEMVGRNENETRSAMHKLKELGIICNMEVEQSNWNDPKTMWARVGA